MADVPFKAHYSVTSVDPPELVRFIHDDKQVSFDVPHYADGSPKTMWNLILRKLIPPTRLVRYCCSELKESHGRGRLVMTGVRWDESRNRRKNQSLIKEFRAGKGKGLIYNLDNDEARRMVESCYRTSKIIVNPIIDWTDKDVWEFIKAENIPYCELYDEGAKRLGCIGCPLSSNQEKEFKRYPKYKEIYVRTFDKMVERRKQEGRNNPPTFFTSGEAVFRWWTSKTSQKQAAGQIQINFDDA